MIETHELDKMLSAQPDSQIIGEFIEWLRSEGYRIAEYADGGFGDDYLCEASNTTEELLADYFGIDLAVVERERRVLLDQLRQQT